MCMCEWLCVSVCGVRFVVVGFIVLWVRFVCVVCRVVWCGSVWCSGGVRLLACVRVSVVVCVWFGCVFV